MFELNHEALDHVLTEWVETFNDCACCPCYFYCDKHEFFPDEEQDTEKCAKRIKFVCLNRDYMGEDVENRLV